MKTWMLLLVPMVALAAQPAPVEQLFNAKLTPAQRANACFALRGSSEPDVIRAMSRALEDPTLMACASENLRIAKAIDPLREALSSPTFEVRAAAARELGSFQSLDLLDVLSQTAQDKNLLVATNALGALCQYEDPAVIPYLQALAKKGGMIADMALDRLSRVDSGIALQVARGLLASSQVPDKLYAMRVIGASGDSHDLPALREIAEAPQENLVQRERGFGFMPPINLSRAAQSAISAIESRSADRQ